MNFVSYAQNFEDVMLWRALKHIPNGTYVDVGAQHPIIDSVSRAFYERGWRGVHIEPVAEYAELLRNARPDELVLQVALADVDGMVMLNVIPETGLSTTVEDYASNYQKEQGTTYYRLNIPTMTLTSVSMLLGSKEVHWLKIDVEGFEEKVLQGWDSNIFRPWIIVIEATIPGTNVPNYANWESILINANYQFVYFDGLNRFYVAKQHSELIEAFSCPPNVFDHVQLSGFASSELCRGLIDLQNPRFNQLLSIEVEKNASKIIISELKEQIHALESDKIRFLHELKIIYNSKSWHLTKPLRLLSYLRSRASIIMRNKISSIKGCLFARVRHLLRSIKHRVLRYTKLFMKPFSRWLLRIVIINPSLKDYLSHRLARFPKFKRRLSALVVRIGLQQNQMTVLNITYTSDSPKADFIYHKLKTAIKAREP